tara:strand:- start:257 stop:664 length:408 start_codon:yes stop_codon:yes gene_type:complete
MTTNLLGIDYGTKHVGFALGNTLTKSSENFFSFSYSKKNQLEQKILEICKEWEISQIIFGMPFNPDGSKNDMCRKIEKFSKKLLSKVDVKIFYHDENYTSTDFKIETKNENVKSFNNSHGFAAKLTLESFMREQL